jgi:hypothetical protein
MSVTFSNATIVRDSDGEVLGYIEKFDDGSGANFAPIFKSAEDSHFTFGELRQVADYLESL